MQLGAKDPNNFVVQAEDTNTIIHCLVLSLVLPNPPPPLSFILVREILSGEPRRAYTYADGFKPRRRREQPAECKFARRGDFRSRRWQESSNSSGREHESAAHLSGEQQALRAPGGKALEEPPSEAPRDGDVPEELPRDAVGVGEAWSEFPVEAGGGSQGRAGGGETEEDQRRPGEKLSCT